MKKKGFLNLKLILIILLIIAVVIIASFFIKNSLKEQELQSLSTIMLQIQAKAKVINERNKVNNTNDYVGTDIPESDLEKLNIENNGKIKVLNEQNLKDLEINDIEDDKDFAVNYETEEVYYLEGYKTNDNRIIYSLTDINNLAVN